MVTSRRGVGTLGCLFSVVIIAVAVYFGLNVGRVFWRYYQFQDDMRQQVRFSSNQPSDVIIKHLRASADSLGLPEDAGQIVIRRTPNSISIETEYDEHIELPLYKRDVHFHPHAEEGQ